MALPFYRYNLLGHRVLVSALKQDHTTNSCHNLEIVELCSEFQNGHEWPDQSSFLLAIPPLGNSHLKWK